MQVHDRGPRVGRRGGTKRGAHALVGAHFVASTLALVLSACATRDVPATDSHTATHPRENASLASAARSRAGHESLPFIHDDYPRALAEAKLKNKPLFVDAWAPWCHSCQSLRAYVLTDPSLAPLATRFVWLSIDTEKDENASWVKEHPHSALPTLWVIDPVTSRPILKWAGTATAEELRALLEVSIEDGRSVDRTTVTATAAFVRGNHALATGDIETAEREFRAALAAAPADHPHRARILEALVTELALRLQNAACAELAAKEVETIPAGTSRASVLASGLSCATESKRSADVDRLLALTLRDARARDALLLPDDRSSLYEAASQAMESRGDGYGAHALAHEWAKFLEAEAERAKTNEARAALDPHRLSAYLMLGAPERAIAMLQQSEKDFPDDYNPPARLGRAYLEMKRLDDADKATDRAASRAYGPRQMRIFSLKADIAKARGDRGGEIAALEKALAKSDPSVLTVGQKAVREALARRLDELR